MKRTLIVDRSLKLQQLEPESAPVLFRLVNENRRYLDEWLPWVKQTKTVRDSLHFIKTTLSERELGNEYGYGIFVGDELVGHMSLMHVQDDSQDPEIGYWLTQSRAGQGVMTKAVQALTRHALVEVGLSSILIYADPANTASNRVAEKAGYKFEGQHYNKRLKDTLNKWIIKKE